MSETEVGESVVVPCSEVRTPLRPARRDLRPSRTSRGSHLSRSPSRASAAADSAGPSAKSFSLRWATNPATRPVNADASIRIVGGMFGVTRAGSERSFQVGATAGLGAVAGSLQGPGGSASLSRGAVCRHAALRLLHRREVANLSEDGLDPGHPFAKLGLALAQLGNL